MSTPHKEEKPKSLYEQFPDMPRFAPLKDSSHKEEKKPCSKGAFYDPQCRDCRSVNEYSSPFPEQEEWEVKLQKEYDEGIDYRYIREFIRTLLVSQKAALDTSKVNRVEVIDHTKPLEEGGGRAYVFWKDTAKVELSFQDDGRTLKIFISPN